MQQQEKTYKDNMKVLKQIENDLPQKLRDSLMVTVMNTEQEETAKEMLKRDDISQPVRAKVQKDLDAGDFRFEEDIVDENISKQIDEYYDKSVKTAIADGSLSHPDDDPFFKKRMDSMLTSAEEKGMKHPDGCLVKNDDVSGHSYLEECERYDSTTDRPIEPI